MYLIDKINEYSILNPEFKIFFVDLVRTITIQIVAQLLFSINNPSVSFLNSTFLQTSTFLCIGVIAFWLIVYKILISYNLVKLNI